MLTDPVFWLAVAAWLLILLAAFALCAAASRGDRDAHRARERREALRRVSGGSPWERR